MDAEERERFSERDVRVCHPRVFFASSVRKRIEVKGLALFLGGGQEDGGCRKA